MQGAEDKKIVYFTVDDSPSKDMKQKVDFLVSNGIPSIWFCRGEFMEANFDSLIYAINKGIILGNHSFTHPLFSKLTIDACKEEINKTEELLERAYKEANIKRPVKVFRFPFGDRGGGRNYLKNYKENEQKHIDEIQKLLKEKGFQRGIFHQINYKYYAKYKLGELIDWPVTCDILEYTTIWEASRKRSGLHTVDDVLKRMDLNDPEHELGLNDRTSSDIILMHDFPETTPMWEPIIKKLLTKDLRFSFPEFAPPEYSANS